MPRAESGLGSADHVVLANGLHRARLRSPSAFLIGHAQAHLVAHLEGVVTGTQYGMAVEIDLEAFAGLDETELLRGVQSHDAPVRGDLVSLHVATPLSHMIFQPAGRGGERVANRNPT